MMTDYKISSIHRKELITEIQVVFYEGDLVNFYDGIKEIWKSLYQRKGKIRSETFQFSKDLSDSEIIKLLNIESAKDQTRTPIDEQKATK